jgi:hypothetical protein
MIEEWIRRAAIDCLSGLVVMAFPILVLKWMAMLLDVWEHVCERWRR